MLFGGVAFVRRLDHEVGALLNGIRAFIKEKSEFSPTTPTMQGHSKETTLYDQEVDSHQTPNLLVA